jgi:hypothetical protein
MNKNTKLGILAGAILAVVIAAVALIGFIASYKEISVTINNQEATILVLDSSGKEATRFTGDSVFKLQQGTYTMSPESGDIKMENDKLNVVDNMSVTIRVTFSDEKLKELLTSGLQQELDTIISAKYPTQMADFVLNSGRLYGNADYYGTTINTLAGQWDGTFSVYRVVLARGNNGWNVVAGPALALSKYEYPDIPEYILRDLNKTIVDTTVRY